MKLNFRKKILLSCLVLFIIFVAFAFPFIGTAARQVAYHDLQIHSSHLIPLLQKSKDEKQMIELIKNTTEYLIFRVTLYDSHGHVLYDSKQESLDQEPVKVASNMSTEHVDEVKENGPVYFIKQSNMFNVELVNEISAFDKDGKIYLLRVAISYSLVGGFIREIKFWFFGFCTLSLLYLLMVTALMFHRINFPVRQIIKAISPYQRGQEESIPPIVLSESIDEKDDFYRLAQTLNSLSDRLRSQIKSITVERDEKEAILESLGEGVIAIDAQMQVRYVNLAASKMMSILQGKMLGKQFPKAQDPLHEELFEKCRFLLKACQEKQIALTDSVFLGDGQKIFLDLIAVPKASRNGAILVLQNNSSHYRVLEMGKDFVANASHELRTPITIIKGFAETLHDMPELPRDMVADITVKIVRNCERMDTLVKNLLTLADLENLPESRFQPCDLALLVETCIEYVHSIYADAQIVVEKRGEDILVGADPTILELAIFNLLENAAKYSNPPAQITIRIVKQKETVDLIIQDQGIGIPPADIDHIFERFYTVDKARSRRLGGAGIGLSIVRTIVEKHHGTISVTSEMGKGTTFTVRLPLYRE